MVNLMSAEDGHHEWSYDNQVAPDARFKVPLKDLTIVLKDIRQEVELGFDPQLAFKEAQRLPQLRCGDGVRAEAVHRVRRVRRHLPGRLHHVHRQRRGRGAPREAECARARPRAGTLRLAALKTGRIMAKDRTCACTAGCAPSAADGRRDMQKFPPRAHARRARMPQPPAREAAGVA